MKHGTVCFLIKDQKILLALIQYSPTDCKWNGVGGYIEEGESPSQAIRREVFEEIGVILSEKDLSERTKITISDEFSLHVFTATHWEGIPQCKDVSFQELKWFPFSEIPYSQMFEGNEQWLSKLLTYHG